MKQWLHLWESSRQLRGLLDGLKKGWPLQSVEDLTGSAAGFLSAYLVSSLNRPCLMVVPNGRDARRLSEELGSWLSESGIPVSYFPALEVLPDEVLARSRELEGARLGALESLLWGQGPRVVVSSAVALARRLSAPEIFSKQMIRLAPGDTLDLEALALQLSEAGYERADMVTAPGHFSLRGGIIDLFPPSSPHPFRLELFGDEVESIRTFDPSDQRSREVVRRVRVGPARELVFTPEQRDKATSLIRAQAQAQPEGPARDRGLEAAEMLSQGSLPRSVASFLPYFSEGIYTLADYLPSPSLIIALEPARFKQAFGEAAEDFILRQTDLLDRGDVLPGQAEVYASYEQVWHHLSKHQMVICQGLPGRLENALPMHIISLGARELLSYQGQWPSVSEGLSNLAARGLRVLALAGSSDRAKRLRERLEEEGIPLSAQSMKGRITVADQGSVAESFEIPHLEVAVVGEESLFGLARQRQPRAPQAGTSARALLADLSVGDYVVHLHHGVGQYMGLRTQTVDGIRKEYLYLRYQGQDRLYVPVEQIDAVQKYVGQEGKQPTLHRLGTAEWSRVKSRVKKSVQEMAGELLALYAARERTPGHAFQPDSSWQTEFEEAFPHEETPDQLRAIAEIKGDMESSQPMDRLLCGDVGYGKTEVALRAAFKAMLEGKQVAFLVPTTILAQQHYHTFQERFKDYPVTVSLLSRFRSRRQQADTIAGLRRGLVDLVVGTHRLLSDDVGFRDLGLLIIDEEHRFGVGHKEKIKRLRHTVDVLTLTATPIPRTLHMALSGLRDMSLIETPPPGRLPVETYVVEYSDGLVRHAIRRELERGGQVFYVHNRVQTLDSAFRRLSGLVPEARIGVGHGQMPEDRLERVMLAFVAGKHDILLSTTIIESGLDIPNVNTLIVENADRMGLAQLYQIRGRVGRSPRQAFGYLTYRRKGFLTEVAEKRLRAIKDFTELGAGFRVALRDLEIRGAGNILGPEQHGFMITVGFDLYCQLLEDAVRELRGLAPQLPMPVIELPVDAYLPENYVPSSAQKVAAYKRVNEVRSEEDCLDVEREWRDRYGPVPQPAQNLLRLSRLKLLARKVGVSRIAPEDAGRISFSCPGQWEEVMSVGNGLRFQTNLDVSAVKGEKQASIVLRHQGARGQDLLEMVETLLSSWSGEGRVPPGIKAE